MPIIAHLDMDAFFASIEERDNPRLAGRPIVVGADPQGGRGRGVVSTANYKAREYGIRSALPISKAWQFSEAARRKGLPPTAFLEVNMKKYSEVSQNIMALVRKHVQHIEQASVDEAYLDLSPAGTYEKAKKIAQSIKNDIKREEHLTASIGIGSNKLIAKIASDFKKPDGLTVVHEIDAESFIAPMSIRVIPGVGPKTEERFRKLGVRTVSDAKRFSADELRDMMGKWGSELYEKLRGRGSAEIVEEHELKSIGEQTTFERDVPAGDQLKDRKFLERTLADLAEDVYERFLDEIKNGASFKTFRGITLTVRFNDFVTVNRATTLAAGISADNPKSIETLQFQALRLFMPFLDRRENPNRKSIRLLGIRVEKLDQ
jgi:nucleotidyltransferase/DNA polymerase involved in DNA repair